MHTFFVVDWITKESKQNKNNFGKMVVNFKVFKKCAPNNMITLYMNRREFVDSVTQVEPIGRWPSGYGGL